MRILITLSLLLFAALIVLWLRSHSFRDAALWTHYRCHTDGSGSGTSLELYSTTGRIWLTHGSGRLGRPGNIYWDEYYRQADATTGRARVQFSHYPLNQPNLLFALNTGPEVGTSGFGPLRWMTWGQTDPAIPITPHNLHLGISHLLLAALLPLRAACHRILQSRRQYTWTMHNLCPSCGYDLRGTPTRCPECGTVPAP